MRPSCGQCPADLPGTGRSSSLSSTCVHSSVYSPHVRLLVSCTGSRHAVAQALEGCAHAGCTVLDHRMHWALRPTVLPSPCVRACGHVPSSLCGGARCCNHAHSRQCLYSRPDCNPGRPHWRPAPPAHRPLVAAVRAGACLTLYSCAYPRVGPGWTLMYVWRVVWVPLVRCILKIPCTLR